MNLRERCEKLAEELFYLAGEYGAHRQSVAAVESFALEIRKEALEEAAKVVSMCIIPKNAKARAIEHILELKDTATLAATGAKD